MAHFLKNVVNTIRTRNWSTYIFGRVSFVTVGIASRRLRIDKMKQNTAHLYHSSHFSVVFFCIGEGFLNSLDSLLSLSSGYRARLQSRARTVLNESLSSSPYYWQARTIFNTQLPSLNEIPEVKNTRNIDMIGQRLFTGRILIGESELIFCLYSVEAFAALRSHESCKISWPDQPSLGPQDKRPKRLRNVAVCSRDVYRCMRSGLIFAETLYSKTFDHGDNKLCPQFHCWSQKASPNFTLYREISKVQLACRRNYLNPSQNLAFKLQRVLCLLRARSGQI